MKTLLPALALLAMAAVPSMAQDPSLNDTELDTSAPPPDDSYLADDNATGNGTGNSTNSTGDVNMTESDLDTSVPPPDASYLDDNGTDAAGGAGATAPPPARGTPGFAALLVLATLPITALAWPRVRRARRR